jgi:UPF0271 protein
MGESFGIFRTGDDEKIAPHIQLANIACGVHGGDPMTIGKTVKLALHHRLKIGAHPSLPDHAGFGRREMKIGREDLRDNLIHQIGGLKGFVEIEGAVLGHVKLHGVIYSMSGRDEVLAAAVCDAVQPFGLALIGQAGTLLEDEARARGIAFIPEFFVDLPIDDEGRLIVAKDRPVDLNWIARRLRLALREGWAASVGGKTFPVRFQSIGIHLDMPNAAEVARTVAEVLAAESAAESAAKSGAGWDGPARTSGHR